MISSTIDQLGQQVKQTDSSTKSSWVTHCWTPNSIQTWLPTLQLTDKIPVKSNRAALSPRLDWEPSSNIDKFIKWYILSVSVLKCEWVVSAAGFLKKVEKNVTSTHFSSWGKTNIYRQGWLVQFICLTGSTTFGFDLVDSVPIHSPPVT